MTVATGGALLVLALGTIVLLLQVIDGSLKNRETLLIDAAVILIAGGFYSINALIGNSPVILGAALAVYYLFLAAFFKKVVPHFLKSDPALFLLTFLMGVVRLSVPNRSLTRWLE